MIVPETAMRPWSAAITRLDKVTAPFWSVIAAGLGQSQTPGAATCGEARELDPCRIAGTEAALRIEIEPLPRRRTR